MNTLPCLAIVVPCYDEESVLPESSARLSGIINHMVADALISPDSFILFVDDGSRDATWQVINTICAANKATAAIRLTANVGQQKCLLAGIEYSSGKADAIITVDADLQDDIDIIPLMVTRFVQGSDIVYGVRDNRRSDSTFKRHSAQLYYRVLRTLGINTIYNHADFRLLSARAIDDLLHYPERNIYLRGLIPQLGYKQTSVTYTRKARTAGYTKYPFRKMVNLALDGITSFSVRPVRMVSVVGLIFLIIAFVMFIYVLIRYFTGETIEGWTSLILSVWFCSGMILLSLGIVGEYIGKIYTEVKHRPRYTIRDTISRK